MVSALFADPINSESKDHILKLTIFYMNDPHGHYNSRPVEGAQGLSGGFAKAQSVINQARKQNEAQGRRTLFVLGGDLLSGTSFSTVFKGAMGVHLLNTMGLDAMVVGNHEFDYGLDNLVNRLKPEMRFALLSSNIVSSDGNLLFEGHSIKNPDPGGSAPQVMIIGLTTPETPTITSPGNVDGLRFLEPVSTNKDILSKISDNRFVLALTHLGLAADKILASSCPRINVIIGGHSHTTLPEPVRVGETLICQAGAYSEFLGRLDIDFQAGKIISYSGKLISLDSTIEEDPTISGIVENYKILMGNEFQRVLGENKLELEASRSLVRSDSPNLLAKLIASLVAKSVGADLALLNGGSIRSGLKPGTIILDDVYSVLPFDDKVVKLHLKGNDIKYALERSLQLPDNSGGKLQHHGIEMTIESGKVEISKINGRPFELDKDYWVAMGEFLASGGDGYKIFVDKAENRIDSGLMIRDLLVNFIENKTIVNQEDVEKLN